MRGRSFVGASCLIALCAAACSSSGSPSDAGCQAESDEAFCGHYGKNCGDFTSFDNCGTSRSVNCGSCDGTCANFVCQASGTTGSGTTGGGTTGGATTGGTGESTGSSSGGAATTGGTTGGVDAGCTSHACDGYPDILTASFVLGSFDAHNDSTIDGLYNEHVQIIVGFNAGTPGGTGPGEYQFPSSTVEISVPEDDAGVIASKMLASWTLDGGINISETSISNLILDMELRPGNLVAPWFGLEFQCTAVETPGAPLVSTSCTNPSVALRYFGTNTTLEDDLFSTSATIDLFVVDGG